MWIQYNSLDLRGMYLRGGEATWLLEMARQINKAAPLSDRLTVCLTTRYRKEDQMLDVGVCIKSMKFVRIPLFRLNTWLNEHNFAACRVCLLTYCLKSKAYVKVKAMVFCLISKSFSVNLAGNYLLLKKIFPKDIVEEENLKIHFNEISLSMVNIFKRVPSQTAIHS